MARKPNYSFARLQRERAKAAKKAARTEAKREKAERRKAEKAGIPYPGDQDDLSSDQAAAGDGQMPVSEPTPNNDS